MLGPHLIVYETRFDTLHAGTSLRTILWFGLINSPSSLFVWFFDELAVTKEGECLLINCVQISSCYSFQSTAPPLDYNNIRDFTLLTLMLPKFFTLLFLATSPSVMHMLVDTIGVVVAKDVDGQYPMTLPVSIMRIPGAIDCTVSSYFH